MRPAIIGASGMLARAWAEELGRRGVEFGLFDYPQTDLTDPDSVERTLGGGWTHVVNCAAWTNVDRAETTEIAALAVNGDGVGTLAAHCARAGATLVHYSTDYVFSGRATRPYPADEPRNPVNAYGRTKARGEERLEASRARWLMVRTSWLYAPWGTNFVRTILDLAASRPVIRVVNDQRGRPTSAQHLARATLSLLDRRTEGIVHVCDGGECTWFEFAGRIVAEAGLPCRVEPCTTAEFPRPAPRPAYSVLDLSRAEAIIGPMPHWSRNVAGVVRRILSDREAATGPAAPGGKEREG